MHTLPMLLIAVPSGPERAVRGDVRPPLLRNRAEPPAARSARALTRRPRPWRGSWSRSAGRRAGAGGLGRGSDAGRRGGGEARLAQTPPVHAVTRGSAGSCSRRSPALSRARVRVAPVAVCVGTHRPQPLAVARGSWRGAFFAAGNATARSQADGRARDVLRGGAAPHPEGRRMNAFPLLLWERRRSPRQGDPFNLGASRLQMVASINDARRGDRALSRALARRPSRACACARCRAALQGVRPPRPGVLAQYAGAVRSTSSGAGGRSTSLRWPYDGAEAADRENRDVVQRSVVHTVRWVEHPGSRGHDVRVWSLERGPESLGARALRSRRCPASCAIPLATLPAAQASCASSQPDVSDAHYVPNHGLIERALRFPPARSPPWGATCSSPAKRD